MSEQKQNQLYLHAPKHILSGIISGVVSRSSVAPFERCIILMQTGNKQYPQSSVSAMLGNIYKYEGVYGLFKGNAATCMRIAPFTAIEFFGFEIYKDQTKKFQFKNNSRAGEQSKIFEQFRYIFCGSLAGITANCIVYPIDLARTILVSNPSQDMNVFRTIADVYRTKGFLSLYRGLGATCFGIGPYAGLKLGFYQTLKNQVYGYENNDNLNKGTNFILGAIAGVSAVSITYPMDFLRRNLQIQVMRGSKMGYVDVVRQVYQENGLKGFYTGLRPTYYKVQPSSALVFMMNDYQKEQLIAKN